LRNIIIQAIINCDGTEILPGHLPLGEQNKSTEFQGESPSMEVLIDKLISEYGDYKKIMDGFQYCLIEQILKAANWNRHEAARRYKMDRSNLIKQIKYLGITDPNRDR